MNTPSPNKTGIAPSLKRAMTSAFWQQAFILYFYGMNLDSGTTANICGIGIVAFWACVPVILFRRRLAPTNVDVFLIHAGTLITCATAFLVWEQVYR